MGKVNNTGEQIINLSRKVTYVEQANAGKKESIKNEEFLQRMGLRTGEIHLGK